MLKPYGSSRPVGIPLVGIGWGASKVRDFPVTAVHTCVWRDGEQAGCVTFQSQLCMHVCDVMGSKQGA